MPLSLAKSGENVTVVKVGGNSEMKKHLADLGFVANADVHVVQSNGGDVIVKLRETTLALVQAMAVKVMVK